MITPDYNASLDFLEKLHRDRWWTLTAIPIEGGRTITETFSGRKDPALLRWLKEKNEENNIYYALNPLAKPMSSKASREDVASMAYLHVDIDPEAPPKDCEDAEAFVAQEQARIADLIANPPGGLPVPTAVIFSGGGYQVLWQLRDPLDINGSAHAYEDAKRYNQQLELIFKADPCHNVDRIMRLPGTINHPSAKKRKKGRTPAIAKLVEWRTEHVYDLSEFTQAPMVTMGDTGFAPATVNVSGNIKRIDDLDDLGDAVSGRTKMLIAQGRDPDNPTKFQSRSEVLFHVCCELVRADIDDDTIFSLLTDPDWMISESVLEKKSAANRYALRQIERARENAIDPHLEKINRKHAVIRNFGGTPRIVEEFYDEGLDRWCMTKSTFGDFKNGYCNVRVPIGKDQNGHEQTMPLGQWWISNPNRRQYERITFAPAEDTPEDVYNLWRGFAVEALPGDTHKPFLEHVRKNICDGDDALYEYTISWMANAVQKPGIAGQTSIVLRGDQGVGKGFFANTFGELFGRHYLTVSSSQHITGNFNEHLRDCVVLFADEAFYAGDKRHASTLKALITEKTIMVTPKGVDSQMGRNCLHMIMASNEDWVIPAGMNERRFCVLDVSSDKRQNSDYFKALAGTLKNGGRSHLLHELLTRDLSKFNVRDVPKTTALQDQKVHSFTPEQEWWFGKLRDGRQFPHTSGWATEVHTHALVDDYVEYVARFGISRRGNATMIGRFLAAACGPKLSKRQLSQSIQVEEKGKTVTIDRPYVYTLPNLKEAREWWDTNFGGPYKWTKVEEQGELIDPRDAF